MGLWSRIVDWTPYTIEMHCMLLCPPYCRKQLSTPHGHSFHRIAANNLVQSVKACFCWVIIGDNFRLICFFVNRTNLVSCAHQYNRLILFFHLIWQLSLFLEFFWPPYHLLKTRSLVVGSFYFYRPYQRELFWNSINTWLVTALSRSWSMLLSFQVSRLALTTVSPHFHLWQFL